MILEGQLRRWKQQRPEQCQEELPTGLKGGNSSYVGGIGRAVAALETATAQTMPGRIADRIKGREFFVCRRYWKGSCGTGIGETIWIIIWAV